MSRDIKFRAWDKENERMYTAIDLFHDDKGGIELIRCGYLKNPYWGKRSKTPDQVELMQYTGHKDRDGVEIYEGDIIRKLVHGKSEGCYEVVYAYCEYVGLSKELDEYGPYRTKLCGWDCVDFEVIGNIYENPELLEES